MCTTCVKPEWHYREQNRLADGTYRAVPVALDYPIEHFLHLSVTETETDYVAYTPSDAYGQADRQVRLRYGRYLRKTFAALTDAEIQGPVNALKSALAIQDAPATLHFATDRNKLNEIFETAMCACGGSDVSCMWGKWEGDEIRPYHVYADSPDVAVAYVVAKGQIIARSVVSVKDREWVRLYAAEGEDNDATCETLRQLLNEAGYAKGNLIGNRLTKLHTDSVMLPYIDYGGMGVWDKGTHWEVCETGGGDYTANCTDGTASEADKCERCDRDTDDCECIYCECCDESYYEGCDNCNMCGRCEKCITHHDCECDRCGECGEFTEPRRYETGCDCDRCGSCGSLEEDCECDKLTEDCECETGDADSGGTDTAAVVAATVVAADTQDAEITPEQAAFKLNRIWKCLSDALDLRRDSMQAYEAARLILQTAYRETGTPVSALYGQGRAA